MTDSQLFFDKKKLFFIEACPNLIPKKDRGGMEFFGYAVFCKREYFFW